MQTIIELLTGLALTEEQSDAIQSWVANRENELAANHAAALANAVQAERNAQSAAMDMAQESWDNVRDGLLEQIEALQSQPSAPEQPDTIAELTSAYRQLPVEIQHIFAPAAGLVLVHLMAGNPDLALTIMHAQEVPPELEEAKAGLVAILQGGAMVTSLA